MNERGGVDFDNKDISLVDIILFLKDGYKIIILFAFFGVAIAIAYMLFSTPKYEGVAQVGVAQIANISSRDDGLKVSPIGLNIEEPALIISRLSSPSIYTSEQALACSVDGYKDPSLTLSKEIKATAIKGVNNALEIKVVSASPQIAKDCLNSVFQLVQKSQSEKMAPFLREVRAKLSVLQNRLDNMKALLIKGGNQLGGLNGVALIVSRDEMNQLTAEIGGLQTILDTDGLRATYWVAPPYASSYKIGPGRTMLTLFGFFGGALMGVIFLMLRHLISEFKSVRM